MDTMSRSEEKRIRTQLKAKYGDEQVFVVPREITEHLPQGFTRSDDKILVKLEKEGIFMNRYEAEYNPQFRQPLPYILVTCEGKVFGMRRLNGAGEARLHGLLSLGVGGHVNPCDARTVEDTLFKGMDTFYNALWRELFEELNVDEDDIGEITFLGIINDNSNPVSQDHLGLVYVVNVDNPNASVKETDKYVGGFMSLDEIYSVKSDTIESWSNELITEDLLFGTVRKIVRMYE